MYQSITLDLLNLVLSFSDALDLASPELAQHQLRTAFITWEIGKAAHWSADAVERTFVAALLHDVGALSPEEKVEILRGTVATPENHALLGEALLKQAPIFEPSAGGSPFSPQIMGNLG